MSVDAFRLVVPAEIEKSKDGKSWKIKGLASTGVKDLQGETVIQSGIDLTPIDQNKGVINFDHLKGPENIIGLLDGYSRDPKGLYIEGRLFRNHTKAKAVQEIMSSLDKRDTGRIGLSIEGAILERDPDDPKKINKCRVDAVAVTMNPVNVDSYANLIKSMNSAKTVEFNSQRTFSQNQVIEIVKKALTIASNINTPDADLSGGSALAVESFGSPKKRKKPKKITKSNILLLLDKLKVLYPEATTSDLWNGLKERLETTYP